MIQVKNQRAPSRTSRDIAPSLSSDFGPHCNLWAILFEPDGAAAWIRSTQVSHLPPSMFCFNEKLRDPHEQFENQASSRAIRESSILEIHKTSNFVIQFKNQRAPETSRSTRRAVDQHGARDSERLASSVPGASLAPSHPSTMTGYQPSIFRCSAGAHTPRAATLHSLPAAGVRQSRRRLRPLLRPHRTHSLLGGGTADPPPHPPPGQSWSGRGRGRGPRSASSTLELHPAPGSSTPTRHEPGSPRCPALPDRR